MIPRRIEGTITRIGHFRVVVCFYVKTVHVKKEFRPQVYCHVNQKHFYMKVFRTKTHFETEAQGNSEMTYCRLL